MQIHELDSFTGTPTSTDYLVIDNGSETKKIPAPNVGATVPSAMLQSEAENGVTRETRVISPYILKNAINYHAPIPSAMTANEAEAGSITETRVISPKVLKDSINAVTGSMDKIVEQGETDGWTYWRYDNGVVEAWKNYSVTASAGTQWGSSAPMTYFYYQDVGISYPSGWISDKTKASLQVTSGNTQWWVFGAWFQSDTSAVRARLVKFSSSSQTAVVRVHIKG